MNRLASFLRTRGVWPAVEQQLIQLGAAYRLERGGKHPVVIISVDGRERRVPFSGSPRARGQSIRKSVSQIRRVVLEMRETAA